MSSWGNDMSSPTIMLQKFPCSNEKYSILWGFCGLASKDRADMTIVGSSWGRWTLTGCQIPSQLFAHYTLSTGEIKVDKLMIWDKWDLIKQKTVQKPNMKRNLSTNSYWQVDVPTLPREQGLSICNDCFGRQMSKYDVIMSAMSP